MNEQNNYNILMVANDHESSNTESAYLVSAGFNVRVEPDAHLVSDRIASRRPDLVIVNIGSVISEVESICRKIRDIYDGPVLVLTVPEGNAHNESIITSGASEVVAKPILPQGLLDCVHGLLHPGAADNKRLELGDLVVDGARRTVCINNEEVTLTAAEFDLLWLLACHPNETVNRDIIYSRLRGIEYDGLDRSIDLRVARLRKKLGENGRRPNRIKSIRSIGYLLVTDSPN